jgi:hypothetical protein
MVAVPVAHPAISPNLTFLNFPARCGGVLFVSEKSLESRQFDIESQEQLCYNERSIPIQQLGYGLLSSSTHATRERAGERISGLLFIGGELAVALVGQMT